MANNSRKTRHQTRPKNQEDMVAPPDGSQNNPTGVPTQQHGGTTGPATGGAMGGQPSQKDGQPLTLDQRIDSENVGVPQAQNIQEQDNLIDEVLIEHERRARNLVHSSPKVSPTPSMKDGSKHDNEGSISSKEGSVRNNLNGSFIDEELGDSKLVGTTKGDVDQQLHDETQRLRQQLAVEIDQVQAYHRNLKQQHLVVARQKAEIAAERANFHKQMRHEQEQITRQIEQLTAATEAIDLDGAAVADGPGCGGATFISEGENAMTHEFQAEKGSGERLKSDSRSDAAKVSAAFRKTYTPPSDPIIDKLKSVINKRENSQPAKPNSAHPASSKTPISSEGKEKDQASSAHKSSKSKYLNHEAMMKFAEDYALSADQVDALIQKIIHEAGTQRLSGQQGISVDLPPSSKYKKDHSSKIRFGCGRPEFTGDLDPETGDSSEVEDITEALTLYDVPYLNQYLTTSRSLDFSKHWLETLQERYKNHTLSQIKEAHSKVSQTIRVNFNTLVALFAQMSNKKSSSAYICMDTYKTAKLDLEYLKHELQYINHKIPPMEKLIRSFNPTLVYPKLGLGGASGGLNAMKYIQKQCEKLKDEKDFLTFWHIIRINGERYEFDERQFEMVLGTSLPPKMVKVFSNISHDKTLRQKLKIMNERFNERKNIVDLRNDLRKFKMNDDESVEEAMSRYEETRDKANIDNEDTKEAQSDRERCQTLMNMVSKDIRQKIAQEEVKMGMNGQRMTFEQMKKLTKVFQMQTSSTNNSVFVARRDSSSSSNEDSGSEMSPGSNMDSNQQLCLAVQQLTDAVNKNKNWKSSENEKSTMDQKGKDNNQPQEGPRRSQRIQDQRNKNFKNDRYHSASPDRRPYSPAPSRSQTESPDRRGRTERAESWTSRKIKEILEDQKKSREEQKQTRDESLKATSAMMSRIDDLQRAVGTVLQRPQSQPYQPRRTYSPTYTSGVRGRSPTRVGSWYSRKRAVTPEGLTKVKWESVTNNGKNFKNLYRPENIYAWNKISSKKDMMNTDNVENFYSDGHARELYKKEYFTPKDQEVALKLVDRATYDKILSEKASHSVTGGEENEFIACEDDFDPLDFPSLFEDTKN